MFSDYIPWKTWDSITDQKVKINKIVEFLDQIMSTPNDILIVHRSFHARLRSNKQYFHKS